MKQPTTNPTTRICKRAFLVYSSQKPSLKIKNKHKNKHQTTKQKTQPNNHKTKQLQQLNCRHWLLSFSSHCHICASLIAESRVVASSFFLRPMYLLQVHHLLFSLCFLSLHLPLPQFLFTVLISINIFIFSCSFNFLFFFILYIIRTEKIQVKN